MPTFAPTAITRLFEAGDRLSGAPVRATDIRAGAGLVIAGLVAEGVTRRRPRSTTSTGATYASRSSCAASGADVGASRIRRVLEVDHPPCDAGGPNTAASAKQVPGTGRDRRGIPATSTSPLRRVRDGRANPGISQHRSQRHRGRTAISRRQARSSIPRSVDSVASTTGPVRGREGLNTQR